MDTGNTFKIMPELFNPESEFLNFGIPLNNFDFVTGVNGNNPDPFITEANSGDRFGDISPAATAETGNTGFFGGLTDIVSGITQTVNGALPAYVDYELTRAQIDAIRNPARQGQPVAEVPKTTQPVTSNIGLNPDAFQIGKVPLIIGGVLVVALLAIVATRK